MTSDGSPYSRLQRAIRSGNLPLINATAAELGWVPLRDALAILIVIDVRDEERFDRAAVRWAGRLALEIRDLKLDEFAGAVRGRGAPEIGGEQATASLAVIRAGLISARERRRVEIAEVW